jgi:hypothetical protein
LAKFDRLEQRAQMMNSDAWASMKAVVEESSLLLLNSLGYVDRNF